ncbi:MAG: PadR family transcriptional regulator [Myxococcales bacterium]|nr:PadR family transcriptional regulator [Myxococcales bacterium]
MAAEAELSDPEFVILALLNEEASHGYAIERKIHDRGFRFWTRLGRSSIYGALRALEKRGLVRVRLETGGGPPRKVFSTTAAGTKRLGESARRRLARPGHPRSELDLGIYGLPLLGELGAETIEASLAYLDQRRAFLEERLSYCRKRGLTLPALGFERPLLALRAEMRWLRKVRGALLDGSLDVATSQWADYEYREPPDPEA